MGRYVGPPAHAGKPFRHSGRGRRSGGARVDPHARCGRHRARQRVADRELARVRGVLARKVSLPETPARRRSNRDRAIPNRRECRRRFRRRLGLARLRVGRSRRRARRLDAGPRVSPRARSRVARARARSEARNIERSAWLPARHVRLGLAGRSRRARASGRGCALGNGHDLELCVRARAARPPRRSDRPRAEARGDFSRGRPAQARARRAPARRRPFCRSGRASQRGARRRRRARSGSRAPRHRRVRHGRHRAGDRRARTRRAAPAARRHGRQPPRRGLWSRGPPQRRACVARRARGSRRGERAQRCARRASLRGARRSRARADAARARSRATPARLLAHRHRPVSGRAARRPAVHGHHRAHGSRRRPLEHIGRPPDAGKSIRTNQPEIAQPDRYFAWDPVARMPEKPATCGTRVASGRARDDSYCRGCGACASIRRMGAPSDRTAPQCQTASTGSCTA